MSFFGQNIRFLRNKAQLSQTAFAELFNLKRAAIGAYEEERAEPKVEVFVMIARHFGVPVEDLICRNLQAEGLGDGTPGSRGIPYVTSSQIRNFAFRMAQGDLPSPGQYISIPSINNQEGLIAFDYSDGIVIARPISGGFGYQPVPDGSTILLRESGLAMQGGSQSVSCIQKYEILYIIKRYQTSDHTMLMLGEISQKIDALAAQRN